MKGVITTLNEAAVACGTVKYGLTASTTVMLRNKVNPGEIWSVSPLKLLVKAIVSMLRTGRLIVEMTKLTVVGTAVELVRVLMNGGKTRPFVLKNTEKKAKVTINCRCVISPPTMAWFPLYTSALSQ